MIIRRSVEIDRPPAEVFAFIRDPDNDPVWCSTVLESEQVQGDEPVPGAVYRQVHRPGPAKSTELTVELLEIEPPHHLLARSTDELAVFDVRYELEELPGGRTRLTQVDDADFQGFAKVLQPVMWFAITRGIKRQFAELKQLLEDTNAPDRSGA